MLFQKTAWIFFIFLNIVSFNMMHWSEWPSFKRPRTKPMVCIYWRILQGFLLFVCCLLNTSLQAFLLFVSVGSLLYLYASHITWYWISSVCFVCDIWYCSYHDIVIVILFWPWYCYFDIIPTMILLLWFVPTMILCPPLNGSLYIFTGWR